MALRRDQGGVAWTVLGGSAAAATRPDMARLEMLEEEEGLVFVAHPLTVSLAWTAAEDSKLSTSFGSWTSNGSDNYANG